MGKVDDLRALREARFEANQKGVTPAKKAAAAKQALAKALSGPAPVTGEFCGHRAVGGKLCIRAKGHQAEGTKSHKYAKTEKQ